MVFAKPSAADPEMLELYSERDGKTVLWAVVHCDFLQEAELGIIEIEVVTE